MTDVVLGDLVKPIGLKGDLKLRQSADFWEAALGSTRLSLLLGQERLEVHVRGVQDLGRGMRRVSFAEIGDRNASEAAVGGLLVLTLPDETIAAPPDLRPFQAAGCRVETMQGTLVGTVIDMQELPAQSLLVVQGSERQHLIPNVPPIVQEVDLQARRIRIDPPPGLLDL